jgi:hypothetical protein
MKLTQRTPEARQAYVHGYRSGLQAAIMKVRSFGLECCGGDGDRVNPETGKRWGETYFLMADALEAMMPKGEIVETYEMK